MSKQTEAPAPALAPGHAALVDAVAARLQAHFDADAAAIQSMGGGALLGPDAQFAARQKATKVEESARPLHPIERIPCHSPVTGNFFIAVLTRKIRDGQPDPRFPDGVVTDLENYEPCDNFMARVPPKLEGKGRQQWIWQEGRQADLRSYVGKGGTALLTARDDLKERLAAIEATAREAATPLAGP